MLFLTKEEDLILKDKLQVLYFYGSWMPFLKKMATILNKMEDKHKDLEFYAIDVDSFKSQCKRFNISSIPSVLVLKNGKEIKRIEGLVLTSAFKAIFNDICK